MAKYAERVKETTASQGTADITLAGAVAGFRTLASAFTVNDYVRYFILDANGTTWEGGYGKLTASTTLTREFVIDSSVGAGLKASLSVGTHTVSIGAFPEMRKTEGILASVSLAGGIPTGAFTDLNISGVAFGARPGYYDTSDLIPWPGPYTSLTLPDWVDRIRVNARITFSAHGSGTRVLTIRDLDNGWPSFGMPREDQPSSTDATNNRQTLAIASGIIDVPTGGGRGFRLVGYQTSGGNLAIDQGFLAVEFVE